MQNGPLTWIIGVPGVISLGAAAVFAYLYRQSREVYSRAWQNLMDFSRFEADFARVVPAPQLEPAMVRMLQQFQAMGDAPRGLIWILRPYSKVLPSVERGCSAEF